MRFLTRSLALSLLAAPAIAVAQDPELWNQVEILRTAHGVPHIRAENLRAAGYALAWAQAEDYGLRAAQSALHASGRMGVVFGRDSMEQDFLAKVTRARAEESFPKLSAEARDVYDGFAMGLNRFIAMHPGDFPAFMPSDFTGRDILASEMGRPDFAGTRQFLSTLDPAQFPPRSRRRGPPAEGDPPYDPGNEGSNAWALAPSRTTSGRPILLRNPHLNWDAGYYEAQMTVPGHFDFYGDFRISFPFNAVGGFNRFLGWATTTTSSPQLSEIYALAADPSKPDYYLLDGESRPLIRQSVTVEARGADAVTSETREFLFTPFGPVIHRLNGKIYVLKAVNDGEYRGGEEFLGMLRARTFAEWRAAVSLRGKTAINLTYADRAGNIFFISANPMPALPHPPGGDSVAFDVSRTTDMWTRLVPFDSMPQFLNPKGGYVHNENNSPHFTNLIETVDTTNRYANFMKPALSLRAQLALQLVGGTEKFSLEDVIARKHSYRMLLADRVKPDLIAAVKATKPTGDVAAALTLIERWDNTAAADSKGAMLFETWWTRYGQGLADSLRYTKPWSAADPVNTPVGLSQPAKAAEAFAWAVAETARRYGAYDVAWGAVHRVRRGSVDVPVGGCGNATGCFRILNFARDPDGKMSANGGDGWILAVEFGDTPRAFSALAYGESSRPESPWYSDQAAMFARGELKPVAYEAKDVEAQVVVRYRPGEKP